MTTDIANAAAEPAANDNQGQNNEQPTAPTPKPTPPPGAANAKPADGEDPKSVIERLEKQLADARGEAAKSRVNAKQTAADEAVKEMTAKLAEALGINTKDKAPDPKELADQLTSANNQYKSATIELAIYRHAAQAGADASALTDSRAFMRSVEKLDPESSDFASKLVGAMKEAVEGNSRLKSGGQAPPKSGAPIPGGSGERTNKNPSLQAAVASRLGGNK